MIISRNTKPGNTWRDHLPDSEFLNVEAIDIATASSLAADIAQTIAADHLRLESDDISRLDELLLFAILARRAADVDRAELSGGELAILDAMANRVAGRLGMSR